MLCSFRHIHSGDAVGSSIVVPRCTGELNRQMGSHWTKRRPVEDWLVTKGASCVMAVQKKGFGELQGDLLSVTHCTCISSELGVTWLNLTLKLWSCRSETLKTLSCQEGFPCCQIVWSSIASNYVMSMLGKCFKFCNHFHGDQKDFTRSDF